MRSDEQYENFIRHIEWKHIEADIAASSTPIWVIPHRILFTGESDIGLSQKLLAIVLTNV